MKFAHKIFLVVMVLMIGARCSAGSLTGDGSDLDDSNIVEAGNPPTPKKRALVGSVPADSDGACVAEVVQAYDTDATILSGTVQEDCSFTLELKTGKVWGVRLLRDTDVFATLVFNNGTGEDSYYYYTADASYGVDLGKTVVSGSSAKPGQEPSLQNDRDGDGSSDYADTDDDGDGVLDTAEPDCDSDGVIDDDDLDSECN